MRLRGGGAYCRVMAVWHGAASPGEGLASVLAEGVEALGANQQTLVVGCGAEDGLSFVDLTLPSLSPDELCSAVGFELAKHCPLPADRVVSGFRILSSSPTTHVRLVYLRQVVWEKWLEAVRGIGMGIDAVVTLPFALDPVLDGHDLVIGGEKDSAHFALRAGVDSARHPVPGTMAPTEATDLPFLKSPGELGDVVPEQRAKYTAALLLGAYGLTSAMFRDRKTGLPLPYEFRPRRNRMSKLLGVGLAVYAVAASLVLAVREYGVRDAYLEFVSRQTVGVESIITSSAKPMDKKRQEYVQTLREQLEEAESAYEKRPTLAAVLVDLTQTVGNEGWCDSFEWRDGTVTVQVLETAEDPDLRRNMELSPVLGDVLQTQRVPKGHGKFLRKFQLNARYDFEGEESKPASLSPVSPGVPLPQLPVQSSDAIRGPSTSPPSPGALRPLALPAPPGSGGGATHADTAPKATPTDGKGGH